MRLPIPQPGVPARLAFGAALLLASAEALAVAPGPEEAALLDGLSLQLKEDGPNRPWIVSVENRTEHSVTLARDPRLLSLSVQVPGKKKPHDCRLPVAMRPTRTEGALLEALAPGEAMRFVVDPRFYCLDADDGVLVPGAVVEARYGFEAATKTSTRGGRKVTERLQSTPPYVAQFSPEEDEPTADDPSDAPDARAGASLAGSADPSPEADDPREHERNDAEGPGARNAGAPQHQPEQHVRGSGEHRADGDRRAAEDTSTDTEDADPSGAAGEPTEPPAPPPEHDPNAPGLREVRPVTLSLGTSYASWETPRPEAPDLTKGLRLEVVRGSDSLSARGAEVTLRLSNGGRQTQRIFFRRELVSYHLLGPDGLSVCAAPPDARAPDGQSFTTLAPGESVTLVTRLLEFCPGGIIDRAGFYLAGAELVARADSNEPGIDAFEGVLFTTRGKPVRVQKGELPYAHAGAGGGRFLFRTRSGGRGNAQPESGTTPDAAAPATPAAPAAPVEAPPAQEPSPAPADVNRSE